MTWFRVFTAVLAALAVFTILGTGAALLASTGPTHSDPVRAETVPPPKR